MTRHDLITIFIESDFKIRFFEALEINNKFTRFLATLKTTAVSKNFDTHVIVATTFEKILVWINFFTRSEISIILES